MKERASEIFGNKMSRKVCAEGERKKRAYLKKYGNDSSQVYRMTASENEILGPYFGVHNLSIDSKGKAIDADKGIIVGNIRMGFGHYRAAMALASVVKHRGFIPYWFDINGFDETSGGKVVERLNELYSFGSRLSQKSRLFNKFFWEPLNYEGFKKLSFNSVDQKVSEIFAPLCAGFPGNMPFIATHAWPAQAALHAGMSNVLHMVLDNWPMALHLAEGAMHGVQSPSAYLGYRVLREMNSKTGLSNPMPASDLSMVGHFIDHELVSNLDKDTAARLARIDGRKAKRVLISVGGAGAQLEIISRLVRDMLPLIKEKKVALYLNFGDHEAVWNGIEAELGRSDPVFAGMLKKHFNNWHETERFAKDALEGEVSGIHAFLNINKFAAVYSTNLLMRSTDLLITKPSELAYYPVPKLMIKRVGGHERWGAIRAAELGEGTYELETVESASQVLRLMMTEDDILRLYNESILKNAKAGLYDGCYKIVDMAIQRKLASGKPSGN